MSEKLSTAHAAYRKGEQAAMKTKPVCPYGQTKIELVHWFWAGYNDKKSEMKCYAKFKGGDEYNYTVEAMDTEIADRAFQQNGALKNNEQTD